MNEPTPQPIESGAVDLVSAALVAVQGELEPASFDSTNPFLRNRYASLGSVIHQSRPILAKHKLAVLQTPASDGNVVLLRTSLIHASGQRLDCGSMELPIGEEKGKSRAQVAGSLITYLRRYAWASVLGMYADEDTDGNAPPKGKRTEAPESDFDDLPPTDTTQGTKTPPGGSQTSGKAPAAVKVGPKYRLQTLNRLKAAPGQENVGLVEGYLRSKLWITGDQTVLDFPLEQLPRDPEDFQALTEAIQRFEVTQREQVQP